MIYCRWSPTLGSLEDTAENIWGTPEYEGDKEEPTVFFGLYGFPDFYSLWRHRGKKYILWAGSDIRHFSQGYWLERDGVVKLDPKPLALWIQRNCDSYVENTVEYDELAKWGIIAKIVPSFLGNVDNFTPQIIDSKKRYYSSVSGNDFDLYAWGKLNKIAEENPDIEYHFYGNTVLWKAPQNVIIHGRVPKEQMNKEVKNMTGAIRMVEFEGCSELIVKSVLWGQKPISLIDYDFLHSDNPREELLKVLNNFPWNLK